MRIFSAEYFFFLFHHSQPLISLVILFIYSRLGNFVKLTDQLIVEHMYEICKTQVIEFVNEVLRNPGDSDGFFKVSLVFTKQGKNVLL